jgi:hypothetical protein
MRGKKISPEIRAKMSQARLGSRNHFFGKKHSKKTKKLIGSKSKNRNWYRGPHPWNWNVKKCITNAV